MPSINCYQDLNLSFICDIILMRTAGPTESPLLSFFQAKKERVKRFFFPLTGCPFLFMIVIKKQLPEL